MKVRLLFISVTLVAGVAYSEEFVSESTSPPQRLVSLNAVGHKTNSSAERKLAIATDFQTLATIFSPIWGIAVMKNSANQKLTESTTTLESISRERPPEDALKIVKALQQFVADSGEPLPGLNEAELAELALTIEEETALHSAAKAAKPWAEKFTQYAALENPDQSMEFFDQFNSWLADKRRLRVATTAPLSRSIIGGNRV